MSNRYSVWASALGVSCSELSKLWDSQHDFWVDLGHSLAYDTPPSLG